MKILAISLIRNEEDILEAFLRYHANLLDEVWLVEHHSLDSSPDIAERLVAEGLPIEVRRDDRAEHGQSEILSALLAEAVEQRRADWILPLDGDEFVFPLHGELRDHLEKLPTDRIHQIGWRTYVPDGADDLTTASHFRRITRRRRLEDPFHRKVLIPAELVRGHKCSIAQGNHSVWVGAGLQAEKLDAEPIEDLALAHFPIRSSFQFRKKILIGWPSNEARSQKDQKDAFHWQEHFDRCRRGPLSLEELGSIGLSYSLKHLDLGRQELVEEPFSGFEPFESQTLWPETAEEDGLLLDLVAEQSLHLARTLSHVGGTLDTIERAGVGGRSELANRFLELDDSLRQIAEELRTQRDGLEAKLQKERRELTHLLSSKSWRWTRPLRALERLRRNS